MHATRAGPRRAAWWLACLIGLTGLGLAVGWLALDRRVVEGFRDGRWGHRVRLYAAPVVLRRGTDVGRAGLTAELVRRGYRESRGPADQAGSFRRDRGALEVFVRPAARPGRSAALPARRVRLVLEGDRIRDLVAVASGEHLGEVELDAPLLEGELAEHWVPRRPLRLEDVPPRVVEAVLLAEDARFWEHPGVDGGALLRALQANWEAGELKQGGSTITQQLVKNTYLTPERTFARKLVEIPMALSLEWHFSKRAILEAYLATVYLGHDRLIGIHGLAEGAAVYLGKEVHELTVADGALLGGIIRAPNVYSPLRHPERALERRNQVLDHLERVGRIGPEEAERARSEPLPAPSPRSAAPESFFVQQVRRELADVLDPDDLPPGSAIFTTLDARLQEAVAAGVAEWAAAGAGPEIAVAAVDPQSGAIRALLGSRDYLRSQLDRATRARRALGPLVEPLLRLAVVAGESAGSAEPAGGRVITASQVEALGERVSIAPPPDGARDVRAGDIGASLLEVVSAYGVLAAHGRRAPPRAVDVVQGPNGEILLDRRDAPVPAVDAATAREVHAELREAWTAGPYAGAAGGRAVAGVAGTSEGRRDLWIVGYSPHLVLGIWVGHDDDRPLEPRIERSVAALWEALFADAHAGLPEDDLAAPFESARALERSGRALPRSDQLAQGGPSDR